ncbi:hypothetical protein ACLOJK_021859 [Asimina triloba]
MERGQLLDMEKLILKKLRFRLNAPTPYVLILRFLKASQAVKRTTLVSTFYLIELCLVEYEALEFQPSLLCAAAIYLARCSLQLAPSWTELLIKHSRYDELQLGSCADMILSFQKAAGRGLLKVTFEKYLSTDRNCVAKIKPIDRQFCYLGEDKVPLDLFAGHWDSDGGFFRYWVLQAVALQQANKDAERLGSTQDLFTCTHMPRTGMPVARYRWLMIWVWLVCFCTVLRLRFRNSAIAISSFYDENSPKSLIVEGVFNAASSGILIYMAFVDLLAADFMNPRMQNKGKLQLLYALKKAQEFTPF